MAQEEKNDMEKDYVYNKAGWYVKKNGGSEIRYASHIFTILS